MNSFVSNDTDLLSVKTLSLLMSQSSELADSKARSIQVAGQYSITPSSIGPVSA